MERGRAPHSFAARMHFGGTVAPRTERLEARSLAGVERKEDRAAAAAEELRALLGDRSQPASRLTALFDGLDHERRVAVVRSLDRRTQRALYERANGLGDVRLVDLVPPARAPLEEVRHLGLNTLPAFRVFEKRFCRLPDAPPEDPGALAGYNFQAMQPVTGPGYFVAVEDENTREVLVDYRRLPDTRPVDWPEIRSNERGLSRFVYGFMVDRLRRVSEHVTIGSASRKGRELGSGFALARADA